jgi:hypothetical protein
MSDVHVNLRVEQARHAQINGVSISMDWGASARLCTPHILQALSMRGSSKET